MPSNFVLGFGLGGGARAMASGNFVPGEMNPAGGTYTLNGESVTIGDIIQLDNSSFDPVANMDAGGIKIVGGNNVSLWLKDPLRQSILDNGATFVAELYLDAVASEQFTIELRDNAQNPLSSVGTMDLGSTTFLDPIVGDLNEVSRPWVADSINKFSYTVTPTHLAISVNGGAAVTTDGTVINASVVEVVMLFGGAANARFRRFEIIEPVADADLPALSA